MSSFRGIVSLALLAYAFGGFHVTSSLGAVRGGTDVCGFLTLWCVRGLGWFCLWALDLVEV
ncbi:hypothetical protein Taro_053373 [Colocasia esculenta]|uniref:Uncharacterized protein n=1 Tax=Colocasia esculenta TaxID=4460 RepID=A0A843XMV5_COLES|nr:hypothetical protein [Colocasia esculenta]